MLCDQCKERPVAIRVTQIIGNETRTVNLCENCVTRQNLANLTHQVAQKFGVMLVELIRSVLKENKTENSSESNGTVCACGLTMREFAKNGILGCPICYSTFEDVLKKQLRRQQGATSHQRTDSDQVKPDLKKQLQIAIKTENYEQAAVLRDQIAHSQSVNR